MLEKLKKTLSNFVSPSKNSMSLPNQFLKYGNKGMRSDWTQVIMSEEDLYTGYSYAAIRNRSNAVARVSSTNVITDSEQEGLVHPYLELISTSPTFTDYAFWTSISTYIDLHGVYYLMAVRNFNETRVGAVQEFKLLNPYQIRRVLRKDSLEVQGYIENRMGFTREIPKEMIIEIRELNPFSEEKPFAMTDAAKESQFTIKTASDYTRHSLKHNINAPGILTTDVILEDQQFENFASRVKNHTKGEPLFGNGKGTIQWTNMNVDLSKSSLKDVNEVNREALFSIAGVSKTMMGIEQSGTTRDTAKVQKDLMIEGQTLPRIQLIIDALNQDYKNNYPNEYQRTEATIVVINPLATDHESDIKKTEVIKQKSDLYTQLINEGYDAETVALYVEGEVTIDQLGTPTPQEPVTVQVEAEEVEESLQEKQVNRNEDQQSGQVQTQEGALKNAILNLDKQIVAESILSVQKKVKNQLEEEEDLIGKRKRGQFINELEGVLINFYGIVMTVEGGKTMRSRISQFALGGLYKLDNQTKRYIKDISTQVAQSHVNTVINDIWKTAREAALRGDSQTKIISEIKNKYDDVISETRAKTIARTEANRAFTRAQYEADRQFIKQNKLEGSVFKQWRTRSDNPCPFCLALEAEGPIPFRQSFRSLGGEVVAGGNTLPINFESLQAGNAHPNCACTYELIINVDNSVNKVRRMEQELEEKQKEFEKQVQELEKLL